MPYASSIVPKLVPAVTIVMPSSDGTRNPMQCELFQQNKICSSILERSDMREYVIPVLPVIPVQRQGLSCRWP